MYTLNILKVSLILLYAFNIRAGISELEPKVHLTLWLAQEVQTCLTCETAHASSGFSSRIRENSIRTLQAAATDCNWFLGTEKKHILVLRVSFKTAQGNKLPMVSIKQDALQCGYTLNLCCLTQMQYKLSLITM